ncbi:hypothetical protein C7C46_26920 [Streptomyces tateyamensis]|uniref:Uncharacterized protein n=1 Tax=Streptomyces tateyamensis TaxID=565073 RepID=A0A2V4N9R4_9ACTN|nr:hypothetical protein [Streptomyces tateyamensis]PYC71021.1 hypothetical protein C7C46_26920 [Streptomyces tateyamensis]
MTTPPPPFDAPGQPPVPPQPATPPNAGVPVYGYPMPSPEYGYPQQPPAPPAAGYGYPAGPPAPPAGQPLVTIGDIAVTSTGIITPAGPIPLQGTVWTATDLSRTEERIAPAGIVLAIIFFLFCLIGLLFLLMKEKRTTGHVQITVSGGGRYHTTSIPVSSPHQVMDLINRVNYARGLCI